MSENKFYNPTTKFCHTQYFGNPKGVHGRCGADIKGIVLHCLNRSQKDYDDLQQSKSKIDIYETDHLGLHFTVGSEGVYRYAHLDDIVWTNEVYGNFAKPLTPPYTYVGYPQLDPQYPMDYQVINIGIMSDRVNSGHNDGCDCDDTPLGICKEDYEQLLHLVNYLAELFCFDVSPDNIKFHEDIEDLGEDCKEHCICRDMECFFNDLCSYMPFDIKGDPTFTHTDNLQFIYGEDCNGDKAKINISDLAEVLSPQVADLFKSVIIQATYLDTFMSILPAEMKQVPLNKILANSIPEYSQPNPTLNVPEFGSLKVPCDGFYLIEPNILLEPTANTPDYELQIQVNGEVCGLNGAVHKVLNQGDCVTIYIVNNGLETITLLSNSYVLLNLIGTIQNE